MKRSPLERASKQSSSVLTVLVVIVVGLAALFGERVPVLYDVIGYIEELLGGSRVEGLSGPAQLVRVSDGDTIVVRLDGREEKVRLIGIDTPEKFYSDKLERDAAESGLSKEEIQALGRQASDYAEALLGNKRLFLEFDATERDRYGRVLAYVYTPDEAGDWTFEGRSFEQVNLEMVEGGWAEPLTIPPNVRYADDYVAASRQAKRAGRGMWKQP